MTTPSVIVFDVNETLSDMSGIAGRFADVGAPESLAKLWFASVLRDGFARTVSGSSETFAQLAAEALRVLLPAQQLDTPVDEAVEHIMSGFMMLPAHPDVSPGIRALRAAGLRLVTLTNGSTQVAENVLGDAGVRAEFEMLLSVEDAPAWKPASSAYEYAATRCGVPLAEMVLVAVHPWDIDGAARAGMRTAWIDRAQTHYPATFTAPTYTVTALGDLADAVRG